MYVHIYFDSIKLQVCRHCDSQGEPGRSVCSQSPSCSSPDLPLCCTAQTCTLEVVVLKTQRFKLFLLLFYKKQTAILESTLRTRACALSSSQFTKALKILNFGSIPSVLRASTGAATCVTQSTASFSHTWMPIKTDAIFNSFEAYFFLAEFVSVFTFNQ